MVFFYQSLEPVPVNSTAVFPGNQVSNLLDIPVESVLLLFRDKSHTWFVALPLRTPMVRVDGQLARGLYVHTTDIPDTEIDPSKIRHVVFRRCLSDKCCYFHVYILLSLSFQQVFVSCHHLSSGNAGRPCCLPRGLTWRLSGWGPEPAGTGCLQKSCVPCGYWPPRTRVSARYCSRACQEW